MYKISNFYTKRAVGRLRPVSSDICIYFNESTTVKQLLIADPTIPIHKFEFVPLDKLHDYFSKYESYDVPHQALGKYAVNIF